MAPGELFYLNIECSGIKKEQCFLYQINKSTTKIPVRIQYIDKKKESVEFSYQYDKSGYVVGICSINEFKKNIIDNTDKMS